MDLVYTLINMKIYVKSVPGLKLPSQANEGEDAAYDIIATTPPIIHGESIERPLDGGRLWKRIAFIEYGTNLYIAPEDNIVYDYTNVTDGGNERILESRTKFHTLLFARSSISKKNLFLANSVGLIDTGYRGQLMLRFKYLPQGEDMLVVPEAGGMRVYNVVNNDSIYQQGDAICQIMAQPNIPITFELAETLPESKRMTGGLGSSGK